MELVRALTLDPVPGEKRHHFREREGHSFQVKKAGGYNVNMAGKTDITQVGLGIPH